MVQKDNHIALLPESLQAASAYFTVKFRLLLPLPSKGSAAMRKQDGFSSALCIISEIVSYVVTAELQSCYW